MQTINRLGLIGGSSQTMHSRIFCFSVLLVLSSSLGAQPDFSGIWMLNGPGTESEILLTEAGRRIRDDYDLLVDDPSLSCVPASMSRIWANPNSGIKIEVGEESILISYELFDLRREIPLGDVSVLSSLPSTKNLAGTYFQEMGSSFARFEGNSLIIESRNHAPGYIRTSRGIPQSSDTIAIEEISVDDDTMHIVHTYSDDSIFEKPLVLEYFFRRTDLEDILIYDCTDADYDWFNELNANN